MAIGPDKVRLQTVVDRPLAEKIHELAERMQMSDSAFLYSLLDCVVQDEEWLIKIATSRIAKSLFKTLGLVGTDRERFLRVDIELEEFRKLDQAAFDKAHAREQEPKNE